MNEEVIKAMNKKESKIDKIHKWWLRNDYKVIRVVFFPIYWGLKTKEKVNNYLNSKCEWSEERANEILSYYIPRKADWSEEEKTFYFFDNGYGWSIGSAKRYLKRKDRRWWNSHKGWSGGKIRSYLIEKFELEGFTKEVNDTDDGWTEISFKLNENN